VLFALFLLALLGISALAIDYASWLVVDRNLQNVADMPRSPVHRHCPTHLAGVLQGGSARSNARPLERRHGVHQRRPRPRARRDRDQSAVPVGLARRRHNVRDVWGAADNGRLAGSSLGCHPSPPMRLTVAGSAASYPQNFGSSLPESTMTSVHSSAAHWCPTQATTRLGNSWSAPDRFRAGNVCRKQHRAAERVCENSAGLTIDGNGVKIVLVRGDIASNESLTGDVQQHDRRGRPVG